MQPKQRNTLWNRNFLLLKGASTLGIIGNIAGQFALSFFVFDQTKSTLASALIIALPMIPGILMPFLVAPWMDRLPRKTFLVGGDVVAGVIIFLTGLYLKHLSFSYPLFLMVSLILNCIGVVDELAYNAIFPNLIPPGLEQKGYAVSSMLYPILRVIMMPLAAVLMETLGVANILLIQGVLCMLAALTESRIRLDESALKQEEAYSIKKWLGDIREAFLYIRQQKGLQGLFGYMAVSNGIATGYTPLLVAFFRTMPGMTAAMYSMFSLAEFLGRSIGSAVQYKIHIPKEKRYDAVLFVYLFYEVMDMLLLWLSYPLMLLNRGMCGFLGANSAIMRSAAMQIYIPDRLRARVNAFSNMLITLVSSVMALAVGALGEVTDLRLCMTLCGGAVLLSAYVFIWRRRRHIRPIYEYQRPAAPAE